MILLFYMIFSKESELIERYKDLVSNVDTYNDGILRIAKEKMLLNGNIIITVLKASRDDNFKSFDKYSREDKKESTQLVRNLYKTVKCLLRHILNASPNEYHLIKLLLTTDINKNKSISNYSILSAYVTLLIQNFLIVSCNEETMVQNEKSFLEFMKKVLSSKFYELFNSQIRDEGGIVCNANVLTKIAWRFLFDQSIEDVLELYNRSRKKFREKVEEASNDSLSYKSTDVPYFQTGYYVIVNTYIYEVIEFVKEKNSYEYPYPKEYYFLFNYHGFRYNRMCFYDPIKLFDIDFYETYNEYGDLYKTNLESGDVDISFIDGKVFQLQKMEEFEFFMGLLQYISCSYKKHIICIFKKDSFDIKVLSLSKPSIYKILDYYKEKNDITQKIKNDPKKYFNEDFKLNVLGYKYLLKKKGDSDKSVQSKLLRLTCSHFLFDKELSKYFSSLSETCYTCRKKSKIEGYFELKLYIKAVEP